MKRGEFKKIITEEFYSAKFYQYGIYRCKIHPSEDENTNKLSFNQKYFESVNEEQPILHENIHLVSNDFTISFSRVENLFYIRDVIKSQDVLIRIYNGQNGNLLSSSDLNLYENIDLFYGFEHEKFSDIPNFTKFRIEVLNENHLIHHEFLYI